MDEWMFVIGQFWFWPFISLKTSSHSLETTMNAIHKKYIKTKLFHKSFSLCLIMIQRMRMIYFSASLYALSWEAWRWRILNIMYCNFMNKQWAYTQSFSNLIQEQSFCKWRSISIGPAWLWLFSVTIGEITTRRLARTVEVVTIIAITYCEVPWRQAHTLHCVCEQYRKLFL